jgi:hypothetical protein
MTENPVPAQEPALPSTKKRISVELLKNIQLCFNSGFGSLLRGRHEMDFRNAVIGIHNGCELLMKHYLRKKDKLLIYQKLDYKRVLMGRSDLAKKPQDISNHTIEYSECVSRLEYFTKTDFGCLERLNHERNIRVHYEYEYNPGELKQFLVSRVYAFISSFAVETGLEPKAILNYAYIESLDKLRKVIDDDIARSFHEKIDKSKHHYYEDLTEQERQEKAGTEDYTLTSHSKKVKCPACQQEAMISLKEIRTSEVQARLTIIKRRLELEKLTCHYCGLLVDKANELRILFADEEVLLRSQIHFEPDDCPDDCQDDCPDEDCPDDCPDEDCIYDCQEDCPDDCQDDCPDDDCPDDCSDDCPEEDCPE